MELLQTYKLNTEKQIAAIRKLSNIALAMIWIAGFFCILVFVIYFLWFSSGSGLAGNSLLNTRNEQYENDDMTSFADKTNLVNIGLKMQEIAAVNNDIKAGGSIRIHKIKYDQQIHKSVTQSPAPSFAVKPIPK